MCDSFVIRFSYRKYICAILCNKFDIPGGPTAPGSPLCPILPVINM
jgi:hypothetical protein